MKHMMLKSLSCFVLLVLCPSAYANGEYICRGDMNYQSQRITAKGFSNDSADIAAQDMLIRGCNTLCKNHTSSCHTACLSDVQFDRLHCINKKLDRFHPDLERIRKDVIQHIDSNELRNNKLVIAHWYGNNQKNILNVKQDSNKHQKSEIALIPFKKKSRPLLLLDAKQKPLLKP